jgi:hypothetical protein
MNVPEQDPAKKIKFCESYGSPSKPWTDQGLE